MKKNSNQAKPGISLLSPDTPFAIRESFNQLRTNLMYTFPEETSCPVFGITSVSEDSGKSTVISNLAISFAQMGKKVLLVDADMRCPTLHRFFNVDAKSFGLSEAISGIQSDVIVSDIIPNLDLITSGHIPPNPSELLVSDKLKKMIVSWKQSYDIIFFDFPPVGLISDALSICKEITGYVFDICSGRNNAKEINLTIEAMEQVGAKIVGIVLNDYNIKGSGSRYHRSRYSGYRQSKYSKYAMSDYEQSYIEKSGTAPSEKK